MQWVRSLLFTTLLFVTTMAFGVVVLLSALLPLSIEQRYVIPRYWGLFETWLAQGGLRHRLRGRGPREPARRAVRLAVEALHGLGNHGADVRRAAGGLAR